MAYQMYRGDYRELYATVTDNYSASAKMYFAVKDQATIDNINASDTDAIFTVDVLGSAAANNGDGTVTYTIKIDPSLTNTKTPGDYYGQCRYVDAAGRPTSYEPFEFEILPDYNQRA